MSTWLREYVERVDAALNEESAVSFAALLRISPNEYDLVKRVRSNNTSGGGMPRNVSDAAIRSACSSLGAPYDDIVAERLRAVQALVRDEDHASAYEAYSAFFSEFSRAFEHDDGNWLLPALDAACRDLRLLACAAEAQLARSDAAQLARAQGKSGSKLEDAVRLLNKTFQHTVTDRAPLDSSKKWGALSVINNLFQLYFRLHTVRLCRNPLRSVDNAAFPPLEQFPLSHRVTFAYFRGRMALAEGAVAEAVENLTVAFERQPRSAAANKRRALTYLVPARLALGHCPPPPLLRKYSLLQYAGLARAIRAGNVRAFNAELELHRDFFIHHGVYLLLEKLKLTVYLNLIHRIQIAADTNKLPLRYVTAMLQWLGDDTDADEVECIVANLIHQRRIKGYISHQLATVVLSSNNAFPKPERV